MIGIVGRIQTQRYTDRDGNTRTSVEVAVEEVYFAGDRRPDAEKPAAGSGARGGGGYEDVIPPEEYDMPLPGEEGDYAEV